MSARTSRAPVLAETTPRWKSIDSVVASFPKTDVDFGWHTYRLWELRQKGGRTLRWLPLSSLNGRGGIYVFLLPVKQFNSTHARRLGKGVELRFPAESLRSVPGLPGFFVAYVGRTTDLLNRLQLHIRGNSKSSSQVLDRMADALGLLGRTPTSKLSRQVRLRRIRPAREVLLKHGIVVWLAMDGKCCTASRHCVESCLIGKYGPPFNIEVEH